MQKRTGTKLRNAVETSSFSCSAKYSPTAKISSYVPTIISSPASKGRAVRPSASVRTVFKHWLPLLSESSRQSAIDILAAGQPWAISSTWVVRLPVIIPFPPIYFPPVKLLDIACLTKSHRSSFLPIFQAQFLATKQSNFTACLFSSPDNPDTYTQILNLAYLSRGAGDRVP